jgi:hypothetical protein
MPGWVCGPLAREPPLNVYAVPANRASPVPAFFWESANQRQCRKKPAVTTGKARDVVGGQDLVPGREWFIDPPGDRNGRARRQR